MGVPFLLPHSSVSCCCGECGCEFQSQSWNQHRSLSPTEAVGLDIDQILSLTNPVLHEQLVFKRLKVDARLDAPSPSEWEKRCQRTRKAPYKLFPIEGDEHFWTH